MARNPRAKKHDSSYALVKKMRDGWYYRLGSSSSYPWLGPFETQHVAERVREGAAGGAWGTREPRTASGRAHATARSTKADTWDVEAGRGLTYDRGDGRGPLLMFNLHRHVEPATGNSHIWPTELDEITREIAAFLNRKKRKLRPSPGY